MTCIADATACLGWTFEQTLDHTLPQIQAALAAAHRRDARRAIANLTDIAIGGAAVHAKKGSQTYRKRFRQLLKAAS